MNESIAKRKSIRSFADKKVEPENVKPYSIVGIGYLAEDADLEAVDRFDASRFITISINMTREEMGDHFLSELCYGKTSIDLDLV